MSFNIVFPAHAPDAEPEKHRCMIETSKYRLFSVVVRDQVHSVLLCPGFTHRNEQEKEE